MNKEALGPVTGQSRGRWEFQAERGEEKVESGKCHITAKEERHQPPARSLPFLFDYSHLGGWETNKQSWPSDKFNRSAIRRLPIHASALPGHKFHFFIWLKKINAVFSHNDFILMHELESCRWKIFCCFCYVDNLVEDWNEVLTEPDGLRQIEMKKQVMILIQPAMLKWRNRWEYYYGHKNSL